MASRNKHPPWKPAGLSPADLKLFAEPVAYLTSIAFWGLRLPTISGSPV